MNNNDCAGQGEAKLYCPKRVADCVPVSPEELWLVPDFFARNSLTLLSAESKAGKTTWISIMLSAMRHGRAFLGRHMPPLRVGIASEEPEYLWHLRFKKHDLDPDMAVDCLPAKRLLRSEKLWQTYIDEIGEAHGKAAYDLFLFDTLAHFNPYHDENDNAAMSRFLEPLRKLTEERVSVGVLHHFGENPYKPRGATALLAVPDLLVNLKLTTPGKRDDRRRNLDYYNRLGGIGRQTFTLNEDGTDYELCDDETQSTILDIIASVLPKEAPGLTAKEMLERWPDERPPALGSICSALARNAGRYGWERGPSGQRGGAFRYWNSRG